MIALEKSLGLLSPKEQRRGLLLLLMTIVMALLETVGVASVMPFFAVLGNPGLLQTNPILKTLSMHASKMGIVTAENFFIALGLSSLVFIFISAIYRALTFHAMNHYVEMLRHSIGYRLLDTYLRQPYEFFLNRHSDEISKTILSEVDQFIGNVIRPIFNMAAHCFVLIATIVLLLIINPWLVLFSAGLFGVLYAFVYLGLKKKLARLGGELLDANKERFKAAGEALDGIKDIKLLGRELAYLNRFSHPSYKFAHSSAINITITQVPKYVIEAFAFGGIISIVILLMVSSGGLDGRAIGEILPIVGLYAFTAYRLQPALQAIFQGFAGLKYGQATVENLYADLSLYVPPISTGQFTHTRMKLKHEITLERLSYTYPGANKHALLDLNLNISVGTALGVVGTTGAGKTTLVDIILGLLRPTEGAIIVDGVAIKDEQLLPWQQSLGYVPQTIFLVDATIAENIAFGIKRERIDYAQVERCAKMAQVHNFIVNELPLKYESMVGERGIRLSGGQRQRIGIARALYHNPEVLVFDEATSALDVVTEKAVMDSIDGLLHQKTIILIAHRLSTVKNCDQIIMMEAGKIKAKGTYKDLVESVEEFKSLAR